MNQPSPVTAASGPALARKSSRWRGVRRAWLAGLAALPLWLAAHALALDPSRSVFQYNYQHWTRRNGLPADKINDVAQTSDGYLWLATQNGLVRFDGAEFKVIPVNLPAIQGQGLQKLSAGPKGEIYFAIQNGGFGSYDGREFAPLGDARWPLLGTAATALMVTGDGAVWTGSLFSTGRWLAGQPMASFFGYTNAGTALAFTAEASGRVWLGTDEHGLYNWVAGRFTEVPDPILKQLIINALAMDPAGRLWIGTTVGLFCYSQGRVQQVLEEPAEVKALLVDRHGCLWVATAGQGLARCKDGQWSWLKATDGLGSDYLTALMEDAEGSLWIGTREGLSQLSDIKLPIYSHQEGLCAGAGYNLATARDRGLWVATDTGISRIVDDNTITNYLAESLIPSRYVKLVFEARNGDVYIVDDLKNIKVFSHNRLQATIPNQSWPTAFAEDASSMLVAIGTGDSLFRIQNGTLNHYQYNAGQTPDFYWINHLTTARDGAIWVASNNGIFRLQNGAVDHFYSNNGLSGDLARWVFEDGGGIVWAGLSSGIARIKDGQIKNIQRANGLPDNLIYAIEPDDQGRFWFDSAQGIFRASRQGLNDFADGRTEHISCDMFDSLADVKFTGHIDQDNSGCKTTDGRIWFSSPWGVVMIDPARLVPNTVAPPVHIDQVVANGRVMPRSPNMVVPPGRGELEVHFTGLSFISPPNLRFRYQLEGYDKAWVDIGNRRVAFFTNLKPGHYIFRVVAANADGVWNQTGDTLGMEFQPYFYQTGWCYSLGGGLVLAGLAGIYFRRVNHLKQQKRALQRARDQLEAEVTKRTAELARAIASLQQEVAEHRGTAELLAGRSRRLEQEIAERGRMQIEIEHIHRQLLETSRQAGMAEVATNVLHNVGNVLNSVNVSALLVTDGAKKSRVSYVGKIAALLEAHTADLGPFLTSDPQGRQVPEFLNQLAKQLAGEQQDTIHELELLRQNIEHIKEIVTMQQSHAKISGVLEIIPAAELVDNALTLNAAGFSRHGIALIREFQEAPPLNVEKHKVLQILINLIRNAKFACVDSGRPDKTIRIGIRATETGVRITVADNGVGIAPENLTRIFSHGFTTRKDGHGFGLHSGALTARELGGTLTVHSEGAGLGADFTLTLPWQPPLTKS